MNFITLSGVEFNNAHFDTSFAWIDQKILKLRPIEGTYVPRNLKTALNPIDQRPLRGHNCQIEKVHSSYAPSMKLIG